MVENLPANAGDIRDTGSDTFLPWHCCLVSVSCAHICVCGEKEREREITL